MDRSPLREYYRNENDLLIYTIVLNYVIALSSTIWERAGENSVVIKTSGFQAVFDLLRRHVSREAVENKESSSEFFSTILSKAEHINFSDEFFSGSSGAGATRIRKCLEVCLGYLDIEAVDEKIREDVNRLCSK